MGFIPNEVINQVLDRCDIVEVVTSYIPLKRAGRSFKALCPFHHEKTPSFIVNPDKQIYHCFGCGVGGNAISFVMQQEHLEFPEAVRFLAEKYGIAIPNPKDENPKAIQIQQQLQGVNELAVSYFHKNLIFDRSSSAKATRQYLKDRQIDLEIVEKFQVGLALDQWDGLMTSLRKQNISLNLMEKAGLIISRQKGEGFYDRFRDRIIFPIFDKKGKCVAFGARTMEKDNPAKYINSPETILYTKGEHLYGFHLAKEAIGRQDLVIVVEGYLDFIIPFQSGVQNVVASLGTALTVDQIRLLRRYTRNVVMLFDTDQAGAAAMIRSMDILIEEGMDVKVATLTEKDDPDSFIRSHGVDKFQERINQADSLFDFKLNYVTRKYGGKTIEDRAKISAELLPTINKFNNAIVKSEYIKRLSQALGVSHEALLVEVKKAGRETKSQQRRAPSHGQQKENISIRPVEKDLLRLMLEEKSYVPLVKEEVSVSDFHNEHVQHIVKKIFELFEQGNELSGSSLISCFDDQDIICVISNLMASEDLLLGNKKKIFGDCVHRLEQERLKSQRREILNQMDTAKQAGNQQKLDELTQQFNQLIKR